jgi:hypothetical protein
LSVVAERRREPQDDLVMRLVEVDVEGRRLSDAELVSTIVVLLNAGHEATVNTLGNGVLALLRHELQWARLVVGEVAPDVAVDELIRWDPPLQLFERWVLEDGVDIAGPRRSARSSSGRRGSPWWRSPGATARSSSGASKASSWRSAEREQQELRELRGGEVVS